MNEREQYGRASLEAVKSGDWRTAKGACGDAMHELGNACHHRGEHLGMFYWFEKAALYEQPEGAFSTTASLREWRQKDCPAAEECVLGLDAEQTDGTRMAFTWFPGAAEAGERVAQFVMGQAMRNQSPDMAAYWFMASYRRGYEPALDALKSL